VPSAGHFVDLLLPFSFAFLNQMSHAYEWFQNEISLTYALEIQEIFGGQHFRPPKKALIRGYPWEILGKSPHIWGRTFSQTFIFTVILRYSWEIFNEAQNILMFGYQSRIYLDMKEYLMDTKRISHGYLTGYLLDIKGYCLDMCGYPDSGLPAPGTPARHLTLSTAAEIQDWRVASLFVRAQLLLDHSLDFRLPHAWHFGHVGFRMVAITIHGRRRRLATATDDPATQNSIQLHTQLRSRPWNSAKQTA
jgi:hypothetical protein